MEPEDIEARQFGVVLRGYARHEVEAFAREVAEEIRLLRGEIAAAQSALQMAQAPPAPAPPPPPQLGKAEAYKMLGEQTTKILLAAEHAATEIRENAKKEAAEVLADARRQAGRIAREVREGRQQAENDLQELKQSREVLAGQLEDIRRRLSEAVARLQAPLEESAPSLDSGKPAAGPGRTGGRPASQDQPPAPAEPVQSPSPKPAPITASPGLNREPSEAAPARSDSSDPVPAPVVAAPPLPAPQTASATSAPPATKDPSPPAPEPSIMDTAAQNRPRPGEAAKPAAQTGGAAAAQDARPAPKPSVEHSGLSNGKSDKPERPKDVVEKLLEEIREETAGSAGSGTAVPRRSSTPGPEQPQGSPGAPAQSAAPRTSERSRPAPHKVQPSKQKAQAPAGRANGTKVEHVSGLSDEELLRARDEVLGNSPLEAARRLKRLLQEDQNDLLDRLRTQRGKGALADNIAPENEQLDRFKQGLEQLLKTAYGQGRHTGGGKETTDPAASIQTLIARQVVNPLRGELSLVIDSGLQAGDTPNAISERAGDVFRVWKGIRTELLGEGIVFAAFHLGLIEAWSAKPGLTKRWVLAQDEWQCPQEVCKMNWAQGAVPVQSAFTSGHLSPPAHGGCGCSLEAL